MSSPAVAVDIRAISLESRRASAGFWSDAWWRLRHDPTTMVAIGALLVLVAISIGADLLAEGFFGWSFSRQELTQAYRQPTLDDPAFWLGADNLGRSQIVRLMYGGRVSLFVGFFGMAVLMTIGLFLGLTSGYFRGWWDDVVVWLVSTLNSIPTLFLRSSSASSSALTRSCSRSSSACSAGRASATSHAARRSRYASANT